MSVVRALPRRLAVSGGAVLAALVVTPLLVTVAATPAAAEPATPVKASSASSATRATGKAFDACTAPSVEALRAWKASPYRTVNTYIGGIARACAQPNLTPAWVSTVSAMGWRLLPTYVGHQPTCTLNRKLFRYNADNAYAVGTADADDALAKARALGMLRGSAIYADIEHYDPRVAGCSLAVQRYVSAWTKRLHSASYLSGIYIHRSSGAIDLSNSYLSRGFARPDAIWMAQWDGNPSLWNWATIANPLWSKHQRIKQYRGDHDETWGGRTINIDSNAIDAPVATVAHTYSVKGTSSLAARRGPSNGTELIRRYGDGDRLAVMCQGTGTKVGGTRVWNRLTNGAWVSDAYVNTRSATGFTWPLPRCGYTGQINRAKGTVARTGPGTGFAAKGAKLHAGALAWVVCQKAGSTVGTTRVWNKLRDGRWVTDYDVSNSSQTGYTRSIPRCY